MSAEAQALLDALAERNEHAATLAMLAAPAVQVEPELLRALRLTIAGADVSAEADLWLSDLVESRTTVAMTLRDEVRQLLLSQFDRRHLAAVTAVLDRIHRGISEVLRIEERVTLAALGGEGEQSINDLLAPLVATLELQQDQSLARWAIRAFDAAPAEVRETQSMWRLMRSSSVMRATQTTMPVEDVLATMPRRAVRMRLRRDALEIEAMRRAKVVVGRSGDERYPFVTDILARTGFDVVSPTLSPGVQSFDTLFDDAVGYVSFHREALHAPEKIHVLELVNEWDTQLESVMTRWLTRVVQALLSSEPGTDLMIPDTVPLMLEINDVNRKSRRVTFEPGETVSVSVRPRDVTVATFNGETYAITPELEVEDYAVVYGAEELVAWLTARDGGRLPRENVMPAFPTEWPEMRRAYIYYAGPATGEEDRFLLNGVSDEEIRFALSLYAEEVIFVVDGRWESTKMPAPNQIASGGAEKELLILNDLDEGSSVQALVDALSGAATDDRGRVTSYQVGEYVIVNTSAGGRWRTSRDFVLREHIETFAVFHLPRILLGTKLHIGHDVYDTGEQVTLQVRPGTHEIAFPKREYFRKITIHPGHNEIDLRWRSNGKWVIVAGTSERLSGTEELMCNVVARTLADHGFGLFVGSWRGVDEVTALGFTERVEMLEGRVGEVFRQYLRSGDTPHFKAARTVMVDDDIEAPLKEATAMIVIGGRGGTLTYVQYAERRNVRVFPIAATGGVAAEIAGGLEAAESAGGLEGAEFSIDEVSARDIALDIVEQL